MASSPRTTINKYGQPHSQEHKIRCIRRIASLEGVDATYGVSLIHPDGQGFWEVSGIAGTAGCYSIDQYNLRPETFAPGQRFRFRLPHELRSLEVIPEGLLLGWTVIVEPIYETE